MKDIPELLITAYHNDVTVFNAINTGKTMEEIIVELVAQKVMLLDRVQELALVAPRKITGPDGTVWIYRCPDHLVPSG